LSIIWIAGHPIFTLNTEMKVEGTAVAAILNKLPGEPVMAPVGLPPELAFLTKKQMLALPVSPSKLEPMVGKFGVKYIVVPKFSTEGMTPQLRHARAVDTIDKLIQMPDKFARISDVDETFMISFNWQQRTAWNPTRPAAIETTNYRMIHGYSIYRVLQN
jgi:hypothetical protein